MLRRTTYQRDYICALCICRSMGFRGYLTSKFSSSKRRVVWLGYRRDREAYSRLCAAYGLQSEPLKPREDEPRDLDRFIEDLQAHFRLSTSKKNLKIRFGDRHSLIFAA